MTLTLRKENDDRPRLEFYPVNSIALRTVIVEEYPFVIGRGDHTKLKINSTSVSREHARLTKTAEGFRLEDMESTNGTEVNGESIDTLLLEDGDTIRIAETELTFRCAAANANGMERMVTQPLGGKKKPAEKAKKLGQVLAQRALNESLLWQTIPLSRSQVIDTHSATPQATFVSIRNPIASHLLECTCCDPYSVESRTQQLAWLIAAQNADEILTEGTLVLRLHLHAGLDQRLYQAFEAARECLSTDRSLGVLLPWEWAVQSPETIALCADLKSLGAHLALDAFTGGATCIESMGKATPDLLVLAPAVGRRISENPRRKKHLDKIVSHCDDSRIQVVLPAGLEEEDCREATELRVGLAIRNGEKQSILSAENPVAVLT